LEGLFSTTVDAVPDDLLGSTPALSLLVLVALVFSHHFLHVVFLVVDSDIDDGKCSIMELRYYQYLEFGN
jgi:hypothetical protein